MAPTSRLRWSRDLRAKLSANPELTPPRASDLARVLPAVISTNRPTSLMTDTDNRSHSPNRDIASAALVVGTVRLAA
jgi:hypothetical protein